MPKSLVIETAFSWGDDRPPNIPWSRTLIYECHVRGMTKLHPDLPGHLRGTYLGMVSDPILDHLRSLGVTAVELLPIQQAMSERRLQELGLSNYWGYNTIGFFAPDPAFATGVHGRASARVQDHGEGVSPRRNRSHPRRRLQTTRARATSSGRLSPFAVSTTRPTTA